VQGFLCALVFWTKHVSVVLVVVSGFDLCWTQLMSSIKFVELARTMQREVHLNKYRLDLMHNGWDIVVEFYCERKKDRRLFIWSCRTQYKGSSVLNVIAISLPLDCCDCLDRSQISIEKTYHNRTKIQVSSVSWWSKALFLDSFLCPTFLPYSLHSRQPCKVYTKRASPLYMSDIIASICLLPPSLTHLHFPNHVHIKPWWF